jgi:hypothetical protein
MTDPHWTQYLAALLTPTVAVFGLWIGYRQWRTAQNKLKLDLFERRLAIYDGVRSFISSVMTTGKTTQSYEMEFLAAIRGAKWLFGPEVVEYIDTTLWHKACDLWCLQEELQDMPSGQERTDKIHKQAEIKKWLTAQLKVIDEKFSPYLALRH